MSRYRSILLSSVLGALVVQPPVRANTGSGFVSVTDSSPIAASPAEVVRQTRRSGSIDQGSLKHLMTQLDDPMAQLSHPSFATPPSQLNPMQQFAPIEQVGLAQPVPVQSGLVQPGLVQPVPVQPGLEQSVAAQSVPAQPVPAQVGLAPSVSVQSGLEQSVAAPSVAAPSVPAPSVPAQVGLAPSVPEESVPAPSGLEQAVLIQQPDSMEPIAPLLEITQVNQPLQPNEFNPAPQVAQASATDRAGERPAYGRAGQRYWYVQGAAATSIDDEPHFYGLVGVGLSEFIFNSHSINLELNGLAFSQPGQDAVGANLAFLLRSLLHREERWALYIDGGAGILGTTSDVPSAGSSFNFTPQVGLGVAIRLKNENHLLVGLRWYHISNANTFASNPGRDSILLHVGLSMPR